MEREVLRLELLKLPMMSAYTPEQKIIASEKLEAYVTRPLSLDESRDLDKPAGAKVANAISVKGKSKKSSDNSAEELTSL